MLVVLLQLFTAQRWVIRHQGDHLSRTLLHRARLPLRRDIKVTGAAVIHQSRVPLLLSVAELVLQNLLESDRGSCLAQFLLDELLPRFRIVICA
jgi:hypothetical protein